MIHGGNAYASQNMRRLHFGLGVEAKIEKVIVEWPGGAKETLKDVALNTLHKIREGGR